MPSRPSSRLAGMKSQDTAATWPAVADSGGAWARLRALLTRVDAPLLAILALGFAFTVYYAAQMSDWLVMTDELLYVKLAQGITDTLSPVPTVHGEYFAVFNSLPAAHGARLRALRHADRIQGRARLQRADHGQRGYPRVSLLTRGRPLATCGVPRRGAYGLGAVDGDVDHDPDGGRRLSGLPLGDPRHSAGDRVTEQISGFLAIAGICLAFLGRTQFLMLAIVLPLALVIHELGLALSERHGASARSAVAEGCKSALPRSSPPGGGGGCRAVRSRCRFGGRIAREGAWKLRDRGPLGQSAPAQHPPRGGSAFGLRGGGGRRAAVRPCGGLDGRHAYTPFHQGGDSFAAILLVVVPALTLEVASFDLRFAGGAIQDRYLFYIAPLLFVGMVACLLEVRTPFLSGDRCRDRFRLARDGSRLRPWGGPYFGSPASAFHVVLHGKAYRLGQLLSIDGLQTKTVIAVATVVLALGAVALIRYAPRRVALLCAGLAVLAFCVVETSYVFDRMLQPSEGRVVSGNRWKVRTGSTRRSPGASVGLVPSPINYLTDSSGIPFFAPQFERIWWSTEFWNKGVDRSYSYLGIDDLHTVSRQVDFRSIRGQAPSLRPSLDYLVRRRERSGSASPDER